MNDRSAPTQDWLSLVRRRFARDRVSSWLPSRAQRLGLLDKIVVLSTVSGGSVIGAYYQAHRGDFASFEARMRALLAQGLAKPMCKKLFSRLGLKVVAATRHGWACRDRRRPSIRFLMKVIGFIAPTWIADKFERLNCGRLFAGLQAGQLFWRRFSTT